MKLVHRVLPTLAVALTALPAAAQQMPAPTPAPVAANATTYVVTILETGAPDAAKAAAMLRRLAAASRKEAGNEGYLALRERGRPGRFAILETWRDKAALDGHESAAKATEERLQPLLVAPPDRRVCSGLDVAAHGAGAPGPRAIYVLTHIDVIPPKKDEAIGLLKVLVPQSRRDTGNERFDVLQQASRPNHSFLVEVWRDRTARNAYVMAEHTRAFRGKLLPLQGSLYDERLYEPIR